MNRPKYERLKLFIKQSIRDGVWKPGEKIPSEHILCERFGVSKITVKKAKLELVAEGVLETLPGRRGVFVRITGKNSSPEFVGVVLDPMADQLRISMLQGIEDKLWEHRVHTILCNANFDTEKVKAYFHSLFQKRVAGVIFTPVKGPGYIENNKRTIDMLTEHHIPYVLLDRYIPNLLANAVVSDNRQASKELTKLLIQKGHARILVVAGVECSSMDDRIQGYLEALHEMGREQDNRLIIRVDDILLYMQSQPSTELERVQELVKKAGEFTACYAMNVQALKAAIHFLSSKGKDSRKEIEIATYDDITNDLMGITNYVTIVKQPGYKMGWEAARLLIEAIHNPGHPIIHMTLQSEIIENNRIISYT